MTNIRHFFYLICFVSQIHFELGKNSFCHSEVSSESLFVFLFADYSRFISSKDPESSSGWQ